MSADSFHHQVELAMKRTKHIYDFGDFEKTVASANSKHVTLKSMLVSDFTMWQDLSSAYKLNKQNPRPYLSNMVYVKAKRGEYNLTYKVSFSKEENEKVLDFLKNQIKKMGFLIFKNNLLQEV
ncbi:hypothetical protein J6590_099644 [Homalodisca vitripennis]|nr:hypothetical protein J6590_099644 [Homalodisca vitripennis]